MITIMLNTNVYGRPYDNLKEDRILKEALASFRIFLLAALRFLEIKSSDVLFSELKLIEDKIKREIILSLVRHITKERIKLDNHVIELADGIFTFLNDYMDSLHIAFAVIGNCKYFITCDDEIIDKLYKEFGAVRTIKFLQLVSISRGDTLKEIEEITKKLCKKEALDLVRRA